MYLIPLRKGSKASTLLEDCMIRRSSKQPLSEVDVAGAAAGVYAAVHDNMTEAREYVVPRRWSVGGVQILGPPEILSRPQTHPETH